jgi:hypothetical protein
MSKVRNVRFSQRCTLGVQSSGLRDRPCSMLESGGHFRETSCLHLQVGRRRQQVPPKRWYRNKRRHILGDRNLNNVKMIFMAYNTYTIEFCNNMQAYMFCCIHFSWEDNTKMDLKLEVLGRTNRLLSLIRHEPH